jgi:hypothetical protein
MCAYLSRIAQQWNFATKKWRLDILGNKDDFLQALRALVH